MKAHKNWKPGQTFTELAAEHGAEVKGNDLFNQLESMVKNGEALSPGEALAKLLNKKPDPPENS